MHRIATRYTLFPANRQPQRAPVALVVRAPPYSTKRLVNKEAKRTKSRHHRTAEFSPRSDVRNDRVAPGRTQLVAADVLRFRQATNLISRDLPADSVNLQIWIAEFLRLAHQKLLDSRDSAEVPVQYLKLGPLSDFETFKTARILHNLNRKYRRKEPKFDESLHGLIENVRQAFASGSIPYAAQVPLHLLGYYKESGHLDEGIEFWKWLSDQDDATLDPIFVGPAIELLAVYGAGLQHCEDVFARTLHQQDNMGSQYQLQSGSFVPDRSKAVTIKGTSLSLLQGILTARLLYGSWRSSYLALDTAFRLRPTQIVPRFLDLFVYERPIFEALPVLFIFCRGGNRVPEVTFAAVLDSLKKLADDGTSSFTKVGVVQAMLQAVEAYLGAAGVLNTIHLNILTRTVVCAMPRISAVTGTSPPGCDKGFIETVIHIFKQLFAVAIQHNAVPNSITFNSTIPVALSLGYARLSKILSEDMAVLKLSPNLSTAQSLLESAGLLRDAELLKLAWTYTCGCSNRQIPDSHNWRIMIMSARRCGLESFAMDQLRSLDSETARKAEIAMEDVDNDLMGTCRVAEFEQTTADATDAHGLGNAWCRLLETIHRLAKFQPGGFRDFHNHPLDEANLLSWPDNPEESWQRRLYDELTQDKEHENRHSRLPDGTDKPEPSAVSNTGISFDELRYLNWKSVNSLLLQAQQFHKRVETSIDAAIQDRRASPELKGRRTTNPTAGPRYAISTTHLQSYQHDINKAKTQAMNENEWRAVILDLRKPEQSFQD
ncbi:MAG: hypothetical protein Q9205_000655 [Flavoplaca limonia]